MITVKKTTQNSIAQKLGIVPGDVLLEINGHDISDVLDYGFYGAAEDIKMTIQNAQGQIKEYAFKKEEYNDIGIESDSFLMDDQHHCQNRCIFCFIDQLPKGLRESLYFKDDDERLSFLFGNYITLTNLCDKDIDRIIEMKISPINISVHTTNKELRSYMMGNTFAGEKLDYLYRLAKAGIDLNCQIVLCRGINDGNELRETLGTLAGLYPAVQSIACVPVGLTGYRDGLTALEPYGQKSAAEALEIISGFNSGCRKEHGVGLVYPADELFLLAGHDVPGIDYYDDLLQLENGVGMIAKLISEFDTELENLAPTQKQIERTIVTGNVHVARVLTRLIDEAQKKAPNLDCGVITVKNEFFGGHVSVAGLLTARDIHKKLKNSKVKGDILITSFMLRREGDMFLDGVTVDELSRKLGHNIKVVSDGVELAQIFLDM